MRALERLNLGFLVHAPHQGPVRRVERQPHDVAHLVDEQRIGSKLEGLHTVRGQSKRAPHAAHRALGQPEPARCRTRAPVRGIARQRIEGRGNETLDLRIPNSSWRPRPRFIEQTVQATLHKAASPLAHGLRRYLKCSCDFAVARAARATEHNTRAQGERLRRLAPTGPFDQLFVLFGTQRQCGQGPTFGHDRLRAGAFTFRQGGHINVQRINDSVH